MKVLGPQDLDLTYDDVLIDPQVSDVTSRFDDAQCNPYLKSTKLPVVSSPMDSIPSEDFIKAAKDKLEVVFTHRFQSLEGQLKHLSLGANGAVIGLTTTKEEIKTLIKGGAKHILLDVANGGNLAVRQKLLEIQEFRKETSLWSGNVANAEGYNLLADLSDYIRVSIGSGSMCSTRVGTGIGRGAITSILQARQQWRPGRALVVADGGLKYNGDIGKALVAGAHLVMLGKMFAATVEAAGETRTEDVIARTFERVNPNDSHSEVREKLFVAGQRTFKKYRGMASKEVNEEAGKKLFSVEGASGWIECSGTTQFVIDQIEANLRSTMSYISAHNLSELYEKGRFIVVTPNVTKENQPHAVTK